MPMTSAFTSNTAPFCAFENSGNALLFRHALVRVAGLPMAAVDRLRCPGVMGLISEITDLEEARAPLTASLVDRLHAYIGSLENQHTFRLNVLHIKRSVFNGRLFDLPPELFAIISEHDPDLAANMRRWLLLTQSAEQRRSEAALTLPEENRRGQDALKDILRQPLFRSGLELANPLLSLNIDKFLDSSGLMNRRARLAERSALRYAYRTACKTSPFSTFTTVTSGFFGPAPSGGLEISGSAGTVVSSPVVNFGILARLAHRLEGSLPIAKNLSVRLTIGWKRNGRHIRYLRQVVNTATGDGPLEMSVAHEMFDLPCNRLIEELIAILEVESHLSIDQLTELLVNRTGVATKEVLEVLLRLLRLNFLVAEGIRPSALSDPLAELCDALDNFDNDDAKAVGTALRNVDHILSVGAFSPFVERKPVLAKISAELKKAYERVQLPASLLPKTLVYEDVAYTPPGGATKLPPLDDHIEGLLLLQRLLPLFNRYHWLQVGMTGYFARKYGAGGHTCDIQSFAMDFATEYQKPYWDHAWFVSGPNEADFLKNYFRSAELDRIQSARVGLGEYIRQEMEAHHDAEQICLKPSELHSLLPCFERETFLSNSFFLQISQNGPKFDLVLNKVYSGLGQMFSRFAPLLSKSSDASFLCSLREMLRALQPEGAVFAEVGGGVDTNLNFHPPLCDYEIAFPGEIHGVSGRSCIALDDLSIKHDNAHDCLMLLSRRLNRQIIPVYHGFLVPGALPIVHQVLLNFSPLYMGDVSLPSLCGHSASKTPSVRPRIALGNLILERRTWFFGSNDLPISAGEQAGDLAYLSSVCRWRRQHAIPDRVFVRIQNTDPALAREDEGEAKFSRKPTYIDFASLLSIQQFQHAISKLSTSQVLVVTEMLPCPKDASSSDTKDQFVSEIVLDLSQVGGITQ
jgi:hypothetical protein